MGQNYKGYDDGYFCLFNMTYAFRYSSRVTVVALLFISPWHPNTAWARLAWLPRLITMWARWLHGNVTLERHMHPLSEPDSCSVNLAKLVKHRISMPEIPRCNPKWVDWALPFLSGMLAGLVFKALSLSGITCLYWVLFTEAYTLCRVLQFPHKSFSFIVNTRLDATQQQPN